MADDRAIACRVDAFNAVPRRSGLSRCNWLRKSRPIMSRAGDVSVLALRVVHYGTATRSWLAGVARISPRIWRPSMLASVFARNAWLGRL